MAKFEVQLPDEIIEEINKIRKNSLNIFGGMTKAGAKVVYKRVKANLPLAIRRSNMVNNLYLSKTYITPSDMAINNKVGFAGYFVNKVGKKTPAPLVANLFEYNRQNKHYPAMPFFRKSFVKKEIETEMYKEQERLSDGLLTK